ncbi:MAG: NUDIX domain-containing protein [Chloroflexi bacterium]|nr:NUDIX domain-containing protein [Chloroflexota bacterium]
MNPDTPNAFVAYTVIMLAHGDRYLLLHRSPAKKFMPNLWTGLGGLVEAHEYDDLSRSALRELHEEAGVEAADITHFALRRVLLHARPGGPLTLLLYYTAGWPSESAPPCSEGTLHWVTRAQFDALDIIDTTRPVLPLLADDLRDDPRGLAPVKLGIAVHHAGGADVFWGGR